MSSITIILRKKVNKQGLFPVAIRITKNKKSPFLYFGQYINEKFWDTKNRKIKKSHPNSVRLHNLIAKKLVSLKIPEKAQAILDKYKNELIDKKSLVFPSLKSTNLKDELAVATRTKIISRRLNRRLEMIAEKQGILLFLSREYLGNYNLFNWLKKENKNQNLGNQYLLHKNFLVFLYLWMILSLL